MFVANMAINACIRVLEKKHIADDKCGDREGNTHPITHIHGSVKKGGFYAVDQSALTALVVHFKKSTQVIGVLVHIYFFFVALWATSC